MSAPRVSLIIVNRDGGEMLEQCLDSISRQTYRDFEVVLVDNGSSDGSQNVSMPNDGRWRLLRFDQNLGFAKANNEALKIASGEFLALVNNDIVLEPSWIEEMLKAFQKGQNVGSVAGRTLQYLNRSLLDSAGFSFFSCGTCSSWRSSPADIFKGREHSPFGAVASAAMYSRAAIECVGFFRDEYFCYYEDTDLAFRLRLHGFETAYAHDAVAYHRGSCTGKSGSDFHVYHLRRNIEYLYWVDMVGPMMWQYLFPHLLYECMALAGAVLRGQTKAFFRAKKDALRNVRWIRLQRAALDLKLRNGDGIRKAIRRTRGRFAFWAKGLFNREQLGKLSV